jgi:tripartite-type tricarboxylate transporter receptor subunit TctC
VTEQRLPDFPDLPTAHEQVVDLVVTKFCGLAGPKGMPYEIVAMWHDALRQVLASPADKEQYAKESLVPVLKGREEARRFTAEFAAEITATLRELGVVR